ncbi:MAG: hypothetical protein H7175_07905 [Burkholderiales bacterium]|nr:hypothetical protein [Anaerolineae bacterium]
MYNWHELMDDLIMGTQGSAAPHDEFPGLTAEAALLKQMALAGAARRAGFVAASVKKMPNVEIEPAPPETLRACSRYAISWLKRANAFDKTHRVFTPIWFLTIAAKHRRVLHPALPYVMGLTMGHSELAPYIVPVLGARGRWLVERSEGHAVLKQAELWTGDQAPLMRPEIPKYPNWIEFHEQMMEGLADE